ncbi:MAG: hypothetical protein ABEK12_03865, partial [Candidatus Nanohaloarchaea archaeon]
MSVPGAPDGLEPPGYLEEPRLDIDGGPLVADLPGDRDSYRPVVGSRSREYSTMLEGLADAHVEMRDGMEREQAPVDAELRDRTGLAWFLSHVYGVVDGETEYAVSGVRAGRHGDTYDTVGEAVRALDRAVPVVVDIDLGIGRRGDLTVLGR